MALGRASSGIAGPLRSWRAEKLRALFVKGSLLRLQFPKEDLGFMYQGDGAAILPDGPLTPLESHHPGTTLNRVCFEDSRISHSYREISGSA